MQRWDIAVPERRNGGGWRQNGGLAETRSARRKGPLPEREAQQLIAEHQAGCALFSDDHGAIGDVGERRRPQDAIVGTLEPPPFQESLADESFVELPCSKGFGRVERPRHRVSITQVVLSSAGGARSMSRSERNCVVEEEQRCPPPGASKGPTPIAELGSAGDPQRTSVVAHDALVAINHASPVAGEHSPRSDGMQITPRVHAVPARVGSIHRGHCSPRVGRGEVTGADVIVRSSGESFSALQAYPCTRVHHDACLE